MSVARILVALGMLVALPRVLPAQTPDSLLPPRDSAVGIADSAAVPAVRDGVADSARGAAIAVDSLVVDALVDSLAAGGAPADTGESRRGIGLRPPAAAALPAFGRGSSAFRGAIGGRLLEAERSALWDSAVSATLDSAQLAGVQRRRDLRLYDRFDPWRAGEARRDDRTWLGLDRKYADLAIDGMVRLEVRTDRMRNERCTAADLTNPGSGCSGGFSTPRIDNHFNIRSGGLIGQRVNIDVDYDSEREFDGNQNIRVFYQGLEDEIIQRIEVGNVAFTPPPSRFLTAAIPSNNFGVNATLEVGPVQFQGLVATQKGSVAAERVYTVGQTASVPQDRRLRDVDFESGRFFWVPRAPRRLAGWPAIDILNIPAQALEPSEYPDAGQLEVYRYRVVTDQSPTNPNLGGIPAVAVNTDGEVPVQHQGHWTRLTLGQDYHVDPSGLWIVLNARLGSGDRLAVSYRTVGGTLVGTLPTAPRDPLPDGSPADSLLLIFDPQFGPESGTFHHEIRSVYRLGGTDVDLGSLGVDLQLNQSQRPSSGAATYLALFGLALPNDAGALDRQNRVFPRAGRDVGADELLADRFLVFPTLQPFADEARLPNPAERNAAIYQTPTYLVQTPEGPATKFLFRVRYNSLGAGDRSTLNLNALQIREGSETLLLNGRTLERGIDYTIDYATGLVSFLDPDRLFGAGIGQVTARFEESGLFSVAPTSIFGGVMRYSLGERGSVNLIGMYQREQTIYSRPQLGFEAKANFVAGATADLRFRPMAINKVLDALVSGPTTTPSRLDIRSEFAFTRPDPNRSGAAYLDEFENEAGLPVSLSERAWEYGSIPQSADGPKLPDLLLGGGFQKEDAVQLTFQNVVRDAQMRPVELHPQDIDTTIKIVGRGESLETVLFMTLHADTAGGVVQRNNASRWSLEPRPGRPRWRSITTALSSRGVDLSRNEYLEFWVFHPRSLSVEEAQVHMVIDVGKVNEDALALAPARMVVTGADTTFVGRQYVGEGELDTERNRTTGSFDAARDDIGVLMDRPEIELPDGTREIWELCHQRLSASVPLYPWGDLSSRCTAGNGHVDGEDLDGDLQLNGRGANEDVNRYVVSLADSTYFVRAGVRDTNGGVWKLYRVPLRDPDATIGAPNLRLVQHLRLTLVAPPEATAEEIPARFILARMRFVGTSWSRRSETPLEGLAGTIADAQGEVIATIISTENRELGYTSPPDVIEQANRRDVGRDNFGAQINEKSLRVVGHNLRAGQRAEAYFRFSSGPQNLLNYRELRIWAHGDVPSVNPTAAAAWEAGELQMFVKLGSDQRNFYLYRSRAHTTTWEPEIVIELDRWRVLRGEIESRWLAGEAPGGGAACGLPEAVDAYVACDEHYVVHVFSPGVNPPNLAAVQEISAGFFRVSGESMLPSAEVWIDDIRLLRPVEDIGTALALDARLAASDVGDISFLMTRRDGDFRQIGQSPTYETESLMRIMSTWRLDRFLPEALGLALPVSVIYQRSASDPVLLAGSDLRGSDLIGLRKPDAWTTTYSLSLRRSRPGSSWLVKGLLDPLNVSALYTRGHALSEYADARNEARQFQANYSLLIRDALTVRLDGLVPGFLRGSTIGRSLRSARIGLWPTNVRLQTGVTRDEASRVTYLVPVRRDDDLTIAPTQSLSYLWRTSGGLTWQPLGMLTLGGDLSSTRDLRHYPDSSPIGRLATDSRRTFLGMDAGVERDRTLSTSVALRPRLADWFQPRFLTTSNFVLSRSLTSRPLVRADGDSAGAFILPQTLNNFRNREFGISLNLAAATRGLLGDSSGVTRLLARVRPIDVSNTRSRQSSFDLAAFEPTAGFMLGLGGFEHFLDQFGSPANSASESRGTTLSSGAELPFGLSATISYTERTVDRYQRSATGFLLTTTESRDWPVGSLRFTRTFGGGPLSLVALGTSVRQRRSSTLQPTTNRGTVATSSLSSTVSPDAQLTLRNGMSLNVTYNATRQHSLNVATFTRLATNDWLAQFSYAFRLPSFITASKRLVRTSVFGRNSVSESCIVNREGGECVTTSDIQQREVRGSFDTDLSKSLTGGLSIGYTLNDASHLSRRISQFSIAASFQLSLFAGDYR